MKSFREYQLEQTKNIIPIKQEYNFYESFRELNEAQIFIDYGKDIDNIIYKFQMYADNHLNKRVNESENDLTFTESESEALKYVLVSACEDFKETLLEELNICEKLINGEISIDEMLQENIYESEAWNKLKSIVQKGAEKVKDNVESIKSKIKEINDFIKGVLNNAIKSVKEMGAKIIEILKKFGCSLNELFKKIGLNEKECEEEFLKNGQAIAQRVEDLKKDNVYETLGIQIKQDLINEADANAEPNKDSKVVSQEKGKGWKKMLWSIIKSMGLYSLVCYVIPGVVVGLFPGTWIALLVPIACKIIWNCKTLYDMWKQFKEVKANWGTMTKAQKIVTVLSMVVSIFLMAWNIKSMVPESHEIVKGFIKNGGKLLESANLGIQPDVITRGIGAVVHMVREGKFSGAAFKESFAMITDSFNKITTTVTDEVVKATVGQSGEEYLKNAFEKGSYKSSVEACKELQRQGLQASQVPPGSMCDVAVNGFFDASKNEWSRKALDIAKEMGMEQYLQPVRGLNQGLNAMCANAGAMTGFTMPVELASALQSAGCLGHQGIGAIIGCTTETVVQTITNVVTAATSMALTLPIVTYVPENAGGFRVRLGEEGSSNFVYEIGKDGIREEKFDDKDKVQELINKTKEFHDKLKEDAKDDEQKKQVEEAYKEFSDKFNEGFKDLKRIVFYGKRVKEKEANESMNYLSLQDYIFEKKEYNIENPDKDTIFKNLDDLRKLIESQCPAYVKQVDDITKKQLIQKADTTLAGSTQIILRSIFATNDKAKTSGFVWDKEFTQKNNEDAKKTIKKRALSDTKEDDKFGPDDTFLLATFLQKHAYQDTDSINIDKALIDIIILKNILMKSSEITEEVKASYLQMVENFCKSETLKKAIAETWTPGKNWKPLEFKVADETKEKIKETEDNAIPPEESQDEIEKTVENDTEDNEKQSDDKKEDDSNDNENEEEEVPVLEFIPFFNAWDLADANDNGPRQEPYSFKGCFIDLEFIEIEGGTPAKNIEKILGELLFNMINNCFNLIADKPCIKDEKGKKFIVNENSQNKPGTERPELGNLSNLEITDILNNKDNAYQYLSKATNNINIAKTAKDKEKIEELKKQNEEKLKNSDKLKEIQPKLFDKEGKLKKDEWDKFNTSLSNYQLSKEKRKKSKGFLARLIDKISNWLGFSSKDLKKADELVSQKNESLTSNYVFGKQPVSLQEYIKLKNK
jgi:hypothetical protein